MIIHSIKCNYKYDIMTTCHYLNAYATKKWDNKLTNARYNWMESSCIHARFSKGPGSLQKIINNLMFRFMTVSQLIKLSFGLVTNHLCVSPAFMIFWATHIIWHEGMNVIRMHCALSSISNPLRTQEWMWMPFAIKTWCQASNLTLVHDTRIVLGDKMLAFQTLWLLLELLGSVTKIGGEPPLLLAVHSGELGELLQWD